MIQMNNSSPRGSGVPFKSRESDGNRSNPERKDRWRKKNGEGERVGSAIRGRRANRRH